MSSHGIARTARSRTQEQRQQDQEKIKKYRALEDETRSLVADNTYGPETLQLTSKLLRLNPEYYTIWNVRRRCLISGSLSKQSAGSSPSKVSQSTLVIDTRTTSSDASSPLSSTETPPAHASQTTGKSGTTPEDDAHSKEQDQDVEVIRAELTFTIPLLIEFPKCYWIWQYRLWILRQASKRLDVSIARRIWQEELGLVGKMLTRDRRNFHAWGYRRHVVAQLESPALNGQSMVEPEFEYTTKMIHMDLSNFSAWHNRSQLIPRLLDGRKSDDALRKEFLDKELDLVREALNVGPEDQSLWYYHQFLVLNLVERKGAQIAPALTVEERKSYIEREVVDIKDLLEDYDNIKWIYEALIEYSLALNQLHGQSMDSEQSDDVTAWIGKLRELDPMRSGRWKDVETGLGLA